MGMGVGVGGERERERERALQYVRTADAEEDGRSEGEPELGILQAVTPAGAQQVAPPADQQAQQEHTSEVEEERWSQQRRVRHEASAELGSDREKERNIHRD
jgi:SRSO17 transposase